MQFSILGPTIVSDGDVEIPVAGGRRRALLLRLLLGRNRTVPTERLIDDLWEGRPPAAAASTLQSHISHLRRITGPQRLRSERGGYRLDTSGDELDVDLFEAEVDAGLRRGDAGLIEAALARWRGAALADADGAGWAQAESARLDELRLGAVEAALELRLRDGTLREVVARAEVAVAEHPLRERLWAVLITALYRSGRQADALRAYQRLRTVLGEQLGIEPSRELRRLEAQVLAQDPALVDTPRPSDGTGSGADPDARSSMLPTGVVTFLLTDIVGSTRLWEAEPSAMARALDRHDEVVRAAVADHHGTLLKARGEGDSTFSVFQRASDAATAALAARAALAAEPWPTQTPVVVRMAVHTGEAFERDGDYNGRTVNRVARLRAIADADQVLVSQATAQLVVDHLPADVRLVEMGSRALRDLERPETVYRLEVVATDHDPVVTEPSTSVPLQSRVAAAPLAFVGRSAELALLESAHEEAGDRCRVVVVAGEPGIGKTALAAHFGRLAHERGATVLAGRCDEDVALPYAPWVEALSYLVQHAPSMVRRVSDLARVLPGIADQPPRGDPEADRYLFFGAVVETLAAVVHDAPAVLLLDDLQWADKPTLVLLRHVVSEAPPGLMIVTTYRDSDLGTDHPLTDALAALRREGGFDKITLGGLADDDLVALMARAAGHDLPDVSVALALAVRRETAGNPFFTWEVMLHLLESGAVARGDDGRWVVNVDVDRLGLPDSVRDVVLGRVARLGDDGRAILATAAVIGRQFELDVLAAALDRRPDDVLDVLERAERRGLVTGMAPGHYDFAHGLVQQALLSGLTSTRRASIHLRVAAAIEALGLGDDRPGDLARHLAASSRPADLASAAHHARRAGDRAMANLAPHEAVRWYEEALRLASAPGDRDRCDLLLRLGRAQRDGEVPAFRETLLEAARLAQRIDEPTLLVRAALSNGLGFGAVDGSVDEERVAVLEAALDAVGHGDSWARAQLLATLASELTFGADVRRRRSLSDEALEIARRIDDTVTLFRVLNLRFSAIWTSDALDERLSNTAEAMVIADRLGHPLGRYWATVWRYEALVEAGAMDEADVMVGQLQDISDAVGLPHLRWTTAMHRSSRAFHRGDVDEGMVLADEMLRLGPRHVVLRSWTEYSILACWHRDRFREAGELLEAAALETPMATLGAMSLALAAAGDLDGARRALAADMSSGDRLLAVTGVGAWRLSDVAVLTEAVVVLGERRYAELLYTTMLPYADRPAANGMVVVGSVAQWLGLLATELGRTDDAHAHFAAAEELETGWRMPFFLARTRVAWARLLLERRQPGDLDHARTMLVAAHAVASERGWPAVERNAAELLASPSMRPVDGSTSERIGSGTTEPRH